MPKALKRLHGLSQKGLAHPAALWPTGRAAYAWGKRVADILPNAPGLAGNGVTQHFRALLGAMARHQHRSAPTLAAMLAHFRKGSRRDWPGLFHCDHISPLPRTNTALEPCFGAHRYHERRTTGRTGASPALVLRGAVKMTAHAATRLHPFAGQDLAPKNLQDWKALRQKLESRQPQRVRRSRFRHAPQPSLATLEKDLFQLILPP